MKNRTIPSLITFFAAAASSALAVTGKPWDAPTLEPKTDWLAILYAVLALVTICAAAFMKSKRTHLD